MQVEPEWLMERENFRNEEWLDFMSVDERLSDARPDQKVCYKLVIT